MPHHYGKVGTEVPVRYKFLSKTVTVPDDSVHAGTTDDFSSTGIVVTSKLPPDEVLGNLLRGVVFIGLNILLPTQEDPIKALGKVEWIEADPNQPDHCRMGLKFLEITKEDKDALVRFGIKAQMRRRFGP